MLLVLVASLLSSVMGQARPYTVTDVSPDLPFGRLMTGGSWTGGRIVGLATDPTNPFVLYAASERAGVWRSSNQGVSWQQSSLGLSSGFMKKVKSPLAVNPNDARQLLCVTEKNDFSIVGHGGLY